MSRSEERWADFGREIYIGQDWICDVCGVKENPYGFMAEPFGDGRHICKKCITRHINEMENRQSLE